MPRFFLPRKYRDLRNYSDSLDMAIWYWQLDKGRRERWKINYWLERLALYGGFTTYLLEVPVWEWKWFEKLLHPYYSVIEIKSKKPQINSLSVNCLTQQFPAYYSWLSCCINHYIKPAMYFIKKKRDCSWIGEIKF